MELIEPLRMVPGVRSFQVVLRSSWLADYYRRSSLAIQPHAAGTPWGAELMDAYDNSVSYVWWVSGFHALSSSFFIFVFSSCELC